MFQTVCGRAYCLVLLVLWVAKSCTGVSKSKENLEVAGGCLQHHTFDCSSQHRTRIVNWSFLGQKPEKQPMTNFLPGIKKNYNYSEKEASLIQPHFTYVRAGISSGLMLEELGQGFNFFPFGTKSSEMWLRQTVKKCLSAILHPFLLISFCLCNGLDSKRSGRGTIVLL